MILLISKIEDWIYCHNQEELNKNNDINYDTINTLQTLADNYLIHYWLIMITIGSKWQDRRDSIVVTVDEIAKNSLICYSYKIGNRTHKGNMVLEHFLSVHKSVN